MIVTLTPNPSLDRTVAVPALVRGAVLRATGAGAEPSGKGVNVALAVARRGRRAVAVLPSGGPTGALVVQLLQAAARAVPPPGALRVDAVPVAGDVRTNTSLREADGTVTKVNEPGPPVTPAEVARLLAALAAALDTPPDAAPAGAPDGRASWLASCGSLPPGAPADLHARAVRAARAAGVPVAVDSSGPALRAALPAGPDLVKPNAEELAAASGRALRTLGDVVAAARALREAGAGAVLASLGADGAVLVDAAGAVHATAPPVRVVSTVGAGDALLAGYLAGPAAGTAPGRPAPAPHPHDRLREALRWAAAAVAGEGTLLAPPAGPGAPGEVGPPGEVGLAAVDPSRPLREPAQPSG